MRLGCGYPMGPLALLDLIGLDTAYEILDTMYKQGRNRLHAPAPILKQMVTAGLLGRKTGRGFYTYEAPDCPIVVDDDRDAVGRRRPQLKREVRRVGVVGSGTMATGIVEVFAKAGYDVTVRHPRQREGRERRLPRSTERWTRRCSAASSTEADRDAALATSPASTELDDLADVDLVVEAVAEDLAVKTGALREPGRDLQATARSWPPRPPACR